MNVTLRYLGPWDLGTTRPWNPWTSSLLQHLLILPLTSSYLLLSLPPTLLIWYGLVMGAMFLLVHSLPLTSSHLLLIPPSYSTLLPNLLLTPPEGCQMTNQFIHEEISMLFCSEKFHGGWVVETLQLKSKAPGPGLLLEI